MNIISTQHQDFLPSEPDVKERKAQSVQKGCKPSLDLGLPPEVNGIIAENFLLREVIPLSQHLMLDSSAVMKSALTPHSRADVIAFIDNFWSTEKAEEGRLLLRHTYQALPNDEERLAFQYALSRLLEKCAFPDDLLEYILRSLPKELSSISLRFFNKFLKGRHVKVIADHFPCMRELDFRNCIHLSEHAFSFSESELSTVQHWRTVSLLRCGQIEDNAILSLCSKISTLQELILGDQRITDKSMAYLVQKGELRRLFIRFNDQLSPDSLAMLSKMQLHELKLENLVYFNDASLKTIVQSPNFSRLEHLKLNDCRSITKETAAWIAGNQSLLNLTCLDLSNNESFDDDAVTFIANSPKMSKLKRLALAGCPHITGVAMTAIANSPYMAQLTTLEISSKIDEKSIILLATSRHVKKLEDFSFNAKVGDKGIRAIALSPAAQSLKKMDLILNLSEEGAKAWASSPYLRNLETLSFRENNNLNIFLPFIVKSPTMTHIRVLELNGSTLSDLSVQSLASSSSLKNLEGLDMSFTEITDIALEALATSRFIKKLKSLTISDCKEITDEGISFLTNSANMSQLELLNCIALPKVTDRAAAFLASSPYMRQLKKLYVHSCAITASGIETIARSTNLVHLTLINFHGTTYRGLAEVSGTCPASNPQILYCKIV